MCLLSCKLSGPRRLWGVFQVAQRGPQRRRVDPVSLPPAAHPLSRCPRSHPQARGEPPRKAEGTKGTPRARTWSLRAGRRRHPAAPGREAEDTVGRRGRSATLTQTGPSSSFRWPRTLGREVACQAAGALPLWRGTGRLPGLGPPRVLRRRRSCASSCSGALAASSPLRAQGQSPRSLQTPKRESESPGCRRAEAEAGTRARSLARGGCSSSWAAQDLTFHPGPAAATRCSSARLARCRRLRAARGDGARPPGRPSPLTPSAGSRRAAGR